MMPHNSDVLNEIVKDILKFRCKPNECWDKVIFQKVANYELSQVTLLSMLVKQLSVLPKETYPSLLTALIRLPIPGNEGLLKLYAEAFEAIFKNNPPELKNKSLDQLIAHIAYARISRELKLDTPQEVKINETDLMHSLPQLSDYNNPLLCWVSGVMFSQGILVKENKQKAAEYYQNAANQGYAVAQFNLAECYAKGEGVATSYIKAVELYRKAAEQGHAVAQFCLGVCYDDCIGIEQDMIDDYKQAVMFYTNTNFSKPLSTAKNLVEAVKWYRQAAELGNPDAQFRLGKCYESQEGRGVKLNVEEGMKWYEKAAGQGHAQARERLRTLYYWKAERLKKEKPQEAMKLYEKVVGMGGDDRAKAALGELYFAKGKDFERSDSQEAARCYEKAVEFGNVEAKSFLSEFYFSKGEGLAVSNPEEAVKLYEKAAELGYAEAQCTLGGYYLEGRVVAKDVEKALLWYKNAYEQGYVQAKPGLKRSYFLKGQGLEVSNSQEAIKNYKRAVELGYADAELRLRELYFSEGKHLEAANPYSSSEKFYQVMNCYQKAADLGHAGAQYSLGVCYERGEGVEKNQAEAAKWYQRAANQGNADAKSRLASQAAAKTNEEVIEPFKEHKVHAPPAAAKTDEKAIVLGDVDAKSRLGESEFSKGKELEISNPEEAVKWYEKAIGQGHAQAKEFLGRTYHVMAGQQLQNKNLREAIRLLEASLKLGYVSTLGLLYIKLGKELEVSAPVEAAKWYKIAAERGNVQAQRWLGEYYLKAGDVESLKEASNWYQKAFNQEGRRLNAESLPGLSKSYFLIGKFFEVSDLEEATEWYKKAADLGHADAKSRLGELFFSQGKKLEVSDPGKASKLYERGANFGHAEAQYSFGMCYERGVGVTKENETEAVKWYKEAAKQGHAPAQCCLADRYLEGRGVAKSLETARSYYEKAAGQGDVQAKTGLSKCHLLIGKNLEVSDPQNAIRHYEKAIELGNVDAKRPLSELYFSKGKGLDGLDPQEAEKWYKKAVEQGHDQASERLRVLSYKPKVTEVNTQEVEKWHQIADAQAQVSHEASVLTKESGVRPAAASSLDPYISVLNTLGKAIEKGAPEEAEKRHQIADTQAQARHEASVRTREREVELAATSVAMLRLMGQGCSALGESIAESAPEEAEKLYRIAVELGYSDAQNNRDALIKNGPTKARRAGAIAPSQPMTKESIAQAKCDLGKGCYMIAQTTPKEAEKLYRIAVELGHVEAQANLNALENRPDAAALRR